MTNGLIIYRVRDLHGAEFQLPESSLDPHLHLNRPQQKLLAGRLDKDVWFRLRQRTWQQQGEWAVSAMRGLAGARISPIPHQLYIASEVAGRWAPRVCWPMRWAWARPSRLA
jgi:ATP-dependent helicase HepA